MAVTVTHSKVSTIPDGSDADLVRPSDWNDEHDVTITAADISAASNSENYLVGTASGSLSAEIVVGTTPGGELGGTWASPTVDATHSGSTHGAAVTTHEAAADPHTGYVREDLFDAAGDLLSASADNTPAKLTKGTTGQFLQAGASTLAYADVFIDKTWSHSGACTTATGAIRWYNDTGRTLTFAAARLSLGTAPTGTSSTPVTNATFVVDLNKNGTTVWGTQSQRAVIIPATNANTGLFTTFGTTTIADGEYLTLDIDFVGSTVAGSDMSFTLWMKG